MSLSAPNVRSPELKAPSAPPRLSDKAVADRGHRRRTESDRLAGPVLMGPWALREVVRLFATPSLPSSLPFSVQDIGAALFPLDLMVRQQQNLVSQNNSELWWRKIAELESAERIYRHWILREYDVFHEFVQTKLDGFRIVVGDSLGLQGDFTSFLTEDALYQEWVRAMTDEARQPGPLLTDLLRVSAVAKQKCSSLGPFEKVSPSPLRPLPSIR